MTYEIKPVTEMDRSWIINVAGKKMIKDEIKRPEFYNPQRLNLIFNKVIEDSTGLVCWRDGKRVGAVGGVLVDHLLCPDYTMLMEVVWYLDKAERNSRAGLLLLKGYTELAKEKADEAVFTTLPTTPVNDASLARYGWNLTEKQYTMRNTNGSR